MHHTEPHQVNPIQLYRPFCAKCGTLTMLKSIEPASEPSHELRTFECEFCGTAEVIKIKFR
jgi:hypothetical protein